MPPEPPPKTTSTTGQPSWMAPVMPVVPDHELLRRIGGGSYGDVWLARTTVGTWRAVKVVFRDRFADARPYEREFNGIQKFEPLSRGNEAFIDILQIGRNDTEGYFYYVMELAVFGGLYFPHPPSLSPTGGEGRGEGAATPQLTSHSVLSDPHSYIPKTLAKVLLQRGRLPVSECLELGLTLNLGLAHLHKAGLIHRDIKPSNIIFVGGVPKLADIGLVVETAEARSFVGTEGFIPPEGPNSLQADLYSLGKVLYEAGMGKDRKDFPEPYTQIAEAPDAAALLEFNAILLKACAANVTERYQSAEEMNADLALLQSGGSVRRQRKLAGQLRFVQRAGAIVTALAAVIALGWWWQVRQTARVQDLAEQKEAAARESHRRLVQIQTANGLRAMEDNEQALASLWFAAALKLSEGDPHAQARERFRLGTLFRQMPKPVIRFRLDRPARAAWLTGRGDQAIAIGYSAHHEGDTAELKVWEIASQRVTDSLIFSNVTAIPVVSSNGKWAIVSQSQQTSVWDVGRNQPLAGAWELERFALSSDESKIAGVQTNGSSVFIRELPSSRLLCPPLQHNSVVSLIAFDPTGRWLLTASAAPESETLGSARIWDAATGKPLSDWIDVSSQPRGAAFSPDGEAVAIFPKWPRSTHEPLTSVVVLDLPSGQARFPAVTIGGAVDSVVFSPDGRHLAIGPKAFPLQVFNALTGEVRHSDLRHENVHNLLMRCSPDGAWLAAAGETGVQIWDLRSGARTGSPFRLNQTIVGLDFLPAGNRLLCADASGLISIYDLANSEMSIPTYAPPDRWLATSGRFSPDGTSLATVSAEGDVNIWPLGGESRLPTELRAKSQKVTYDRFLETQIAWSPDGALLAAARNDSTVRLWVVATGQELHSPLQHDGFVPHLEFNSQGTHLATASLDGTARIWEVATGRPAVILRHEGPVVQIRFSPDGRRVLSATKNGEARLWNAYSGEPFGPPPKRFNEITDLAISPDGSRAAVAGDDGEVLLMDARSGEALGSVAQHAGKVYRVCFTPDGRHLLTASHDKTAQLWELASGRPAIPPMVHRDVVRTAEFSPDGRRLVTGCADGVARIWEAVTGEPLSGPIRQAGPILSTHFSPDGNCVFISSLNGSAEIREVPSLDWSTDEIIAAAQLFAGATLDQAGQTRPLPPALVEETWAKVPLPLLLDSASQSGGLLSWHQQQLLLSERAHDWFAAEFHARQLMQLLPAAPGPRADLLRLQALRPPPRDPAASAQLINLTAYYNGPLAVNWLQGDPENHLGELPRGIKQLAGTLFDIRGLIQLRGQPPAGGAFKYPLRVDGIRVRQKLRHLHILHSNTGDTWHVKTGASIGHYRVHYTNGRTEEIPIRYNVDLGDWWEWLGGAVPEAAVAWRGINPIARHQGMTAVRLFKCTWANPAPELEISHVDFVSEGNVGRPFLIALTAE